MYCRGMPSKILYFKLVFRYIKQSLKRSRCKDFSLPTRMKNGLYSYILYVSYFRLTNFFPSFNFDIVLELIPRQNDDYLDDSFELFSLIFWFFIPGFYVVHFFYSPKTPIEKRGRLSPLHFFRRHCFNIFTIYLLYHISPIYVRLS